MKTTRLFATVLTLALCSAARAQTLDHAKLDQLFNRLLAKNKGMGSLVLATDGAVLYGRSFGCRKVSENDKTLVAATENERRNRRGYRQRTISVRAGHQDRLQQ